MLRNLFGRSCQLWVEQESSLKLTDCQLAKHLLDNHEVTCHCNSKPKQVVTLCDPWDRSSQQECLQLPSVSTPRKNKDLGNCWQHTMHTNLIYLTRMVTKGCFERPISFKQGGLPNHGSYEPYYPVGNSFSADIIQGCSVGKECDILLLGCGDIRNILHTLYVMGQEKNVKGRKLNFHLNDIEDAILARDYILLHLIRNVDPGKHDDMNFLWAVWYDIILSETHMNRLKGLMKKMTENYPDDDDIYFGNDNTKTRLRQALTLWMNMKITGRSAINKRTAFLKGIYQINFPEAPVNRISSKILNQLNTTQTTVERYKEEIRDFILTGQTGINRTSSSSDDLMESTHGNMTFYRPGSEHWEVEDNSCPFMCYDPGLEIERYDGVQTKMSFLCMGILQKWVYNFQKEIKDGFQIKFFLWLGEATSLCQEDLPKDLQFDFIDTSNIADRLGIIPVLTNIQKRLNRHNGVMRTEIYHWRGAAKSVEEFLRLCLDIPLTMYPTVFGLHLAEELTLGHEQVPEVGSYVGLGRLSLRWKIARVADTLCQTPLETDGVSKVLNELAHPTYKRDTRKDCNTPGGTVEALKCGKAVRDTLRRNLVSKLQEHPGSLNDGTFKLDKGTHVIYEFDSHYEATIVTDPGYLIGGTISVTHDDDDPFVVTFQNKTGGVQTFNRTFTFSCGISISASKIKLSRKRGFIESSLVKDYERTMGERVLPWKVLEPKDVISLPDYPQSDFAINQLLLNVAYMYPKPDLKGQVSGPPFYQLEELIQSFLHTLPVTNGIPCFVSTGVESSHRYLLEGLKEFEKLPTTFITWYDLELGQRLVMEGKVNPLEFYEVCAKPNYEPIQQYAKHLAEGNELLKRVLRVNAFRMKQELPQDRWKIKTFLRARYLFSDFQSLLWELTSNEVKQATVDMVKRVMDGEDLSDIIRKLYVDSRLGTEPQTLSTPSAAHTARTSSTPSPSTVTTSKTCVVCSETSNCRRCTGCLEVWYCSKKCQSKDWSNHKPKCKKN